MSTLPLTPPSTPRLSHSRMAMPVKHPTKKKEECLHESVTRLFDQSQPQRCDLCGRNSDLGWVFRCTKETRGVLPDIEFAKPNHNGSNLKPDSRPKISSDHSHASDKFTSTVKSSLLATNKIDYSGEVAPTLSQSTQNSSLSLSPTIGEELKIRENTNVVFPDSISPSSVSFTSSCTFRCCLRCRANVRDRSWQSINAIINESVMPVSQYELQNRPVSNAVILAKMNYSGDRISKSTRSRTQKDNKTGADPVEIKSKRKPDRDGEPKIDDGEKAVILPIRSTTTSSTSTPTLSHSQCKKAASRDIDKENWEKRMGLRLSKGRFFID